VRQARFLLTGDLKPEEDETTWWIPLGIKSGSKSAEAKNVALTTKEETIRDTDDTFYKLNTNNTGFYRTNYPPERLARLGKAQDRLSVEDKIGLISDATALAIAGDGTTAGLLAFIEDFKDESDYL
jgi:aminopeptidase N